MPVAETASHDTLVARMRARGVRLTSQRRVIAEVLESAEEHLDADAVFRRAARVDPGIHRATVYRTLNALKKLRLIDELDLMHVEGDRHYYEVRPSAFHLHLVCLSCGKVLEPSAPFWEDVRRKLQRETGFRTELARLEIGGRCPDCQTRSSGATGAQ